MDNVIAIIRDLGFPIACVIALAWYSFKTTDKIIALTEKVTDALAKNAESLRDLTEAIKEMGEK